MKEYGGFIEFETYGGNILHEDAIALNCGRNALAYLCEAKNIRKVYIPYFLCSSVPDLLNKIDVEFSYYHIDSYFRPIFNKKLFDNEYLYIVNYYAQIGNVEIQKWKDKYQNVIIDNAQSYYQLPIKNTDTLYTCRKFFGVSDGAFLYTNAKLNRILPLEESFDRMQFLTGRFERSANEFYKEYVENNRLFVNEPIKEMSKLTNNLLCGIDYSKHAIIRQNNFDYLYHAFSNRNELELMVPYGAFMYPLLIENGSKVRKLLQSKKIYIPTLWPNVLDIVDNDSLEYHYANDILPIPVDQRYNLEDMEYLVKVVNECIELSKEAGVINEY